MRDSLRAKCRRCTRLVPLEFDTDGHGHLVEYLAKHYCVRPAIPAPALEEMVRPRPPQRIEDPAILAEAKRRRRAGICRDCDAPVEGVVGRAERCAPCRRLHRRRAESAMYARTEARRAGTCATCGGVIPPQQGRPKYHATEACHPRLANLLQQRDRDRLRAQRATAHA